jgi:hypothetical protein
LTWASENGASGAKMRNMSAQHTTTRRRISCGGCTGAGTEQLPTAGLKSKNLCEQPISDFHPQELECYASMPIPGGATHSVCVVEHAFVPKLGCERRETGTQIALLHSLKQLVRMVEPCAEACGWLAQAVHQEPF